VNRCLISLACLFVVAAWPERAALAQKPPDAKPAPGGPLKCFDRIMENILREYCIVGGALAIAVDGRLVLARGYGLANGAANEPMRPDHLFCTASGSKAIDAVAVMKLVKDGKLDLDTPLLKFLSRFMPMGKITDPRVRRITVRHLLYHAGGWEVKKRGQAK
jgi:CubicO group peptidase (beta-lactamase class C family)